MSGPVARLRLRLKNERHPYTGLPLWWYERAAREYDDAHPEIFNAVEQERLRHGLEVALAHVRTATDRPRRALDFGCGSGNVSAHLLSLGARVVAADVSPFFLDRVERRFGAGSGIETVLLNGSDLSSLADESFDLVATYSVLHHIHAYLQVVGELARVTRPGGVIYIDHESNENAWRSDGCLAEFRAALERDASPPAAARDRTKRWQRFLRPSPYRLRAQLLLRKLLPATSRFYPPLQFEREADIHVWPWRHVEWERIERRLLDEGCEILRRDDYLVYREGYPRALYEDYKDRCTDMRMLLARKC